MKISDLKQPYRRMAEYLAEINTNENYYDKTILYNAFDWGLTDDLFWDEIFYNGNHPEITPQIKKHFPADFDFSGEVEDEKRYNFAFKNNMEEKYTQLAKDGKFDDLPDTCEFSDAVELEVWDGVMKKLLKLISGKYKGLYMDLEFQAWDYAQLPTPKIDFSEFKNGDAIEIELVHNETRIGWFDYADANHVVINVLKRKGNHVTNGGSCAGSKMLNKEKIKSITKIK